MCSRVRRVAFAFLTVPVALSSVGLVGCQRSQQEPSPPPLPAADIESLHNQGVALMGQFNYVEAAKAFEQVATERPNSSDSQVNLAIALLNRREADDLTRSADLLDSAIADDPDNLRAKYCRALLYFHEGDFTAARRLFEQVAAADPNDGYAVYYVAQCLFSDGQFGEALQQYRQAQRIDPYLRSAYYGAFQAAQRLGEREATEEGLATFQRLADNPRARLAELKYTRMGPKAEVVATSTASSDIARHPPIGPLFQPPAPLKMASGQSAEWRAARSETSALSISMADINGDQQTDIFIAGGLGSNGNPPHNVVLLSLDGEYALQQRHPLASVASVQAALWGDVDGDGLLDVYLCRDGPNQLWRQTSPGEWTDITASAQVAGGEARTVDGACFDADHDGDLDIFLVNSDAPNELLNNNRDGTFSPLAQQLGIAGDDGGSRRAVVADLDGDDDADLLVLKDTPPHDVFINDRLWEYHAGEGFDELCAAQLWGAVAVDANVDGRTELFTIGPQGVLRWSPGEGRTWQSTHVIPPDPEQSIADYVGLALHDFRGDGNLQILVTGAESWRLFNLEGERLDASGEDFRGPVGVLVGMEGPQLVAHRSAAPPLHWRAGAGRFAFVRLQFTGRTDRGQDMRTNASGIGVQGAARIGERWVPLPEFRRDSGPGQSLQPIAVGLGGAESIDFVQLLWPDGVSQTELGLKPHELHVIEETQRQVGSCPLVFVWNGERYQFVADILGAAGIGFNLGKGEYHDPRPEESLLIGPGILQPLGDRFHIKLGEPMEEISYFDSVRLMAFDVPPGWEMTLDERFGVAAPLPTGEPRFFSRQLMPASAFNDRGEDVTEAIATCDRQAAPLARFDGRFVGLTDRHSITLTFAEPLDELANPVLVFDGWVEYPYSQTAFAAWQAGAQFELPSIDAKGADGQWIPIAEAFGYTAGTPRQASVPLPRERLPTGTRELRIRTNLHVYWDRLMVIDAEENPAVRRHELHLFAAKVDDVGFATRKLLEQRYPVYDYDDRPPLGDTRHPSGFYTQFGDATQLLTTTDDALAIIGPGEEVHLEFAACETEPQRGWARYFVLAVEGWCKDADPYTRHGGTVDPLPQRIHHPTPQQAARRDALHQKYNVRYRSDR